MDRDEWFAAYVIPNLSKLHAYAYRLCRNRYEAEDLVQSAMLRLLRIWHECDTSRPVVPWLCTVVRNAWRNDITYRTAQKRTLPPGQRIDPLNLMTEIDDKAYEQLSIHDQLGEFFDILQQMPALSGRTVFLKAYGFSYPEISEQLGIPVNRLQGHWNVGINWIRKHYPEVGKMSDAFEREVLVHQNFLYSMAMKKYCNNNPDNAHDLVQETLLKAFKSFHQYTEGTNCRAWLMIIMRNTHINQYRINKRAPRMHSVLDEETGKEIPGIPAQRSAEDEAMDNAIDPKLVKALAKMPIVFAEAVYLADVQGLTYREIADRLECPIGTVMSRLFRGRKFLKLYYLEAEDEAATALG